MIGGIDINISFSIGVVLIVTLLATIDDLRRRIISPYLTYPTFLAGMAYSGWFVLGGILGLMENGNWGEVLTLFWIWVEPAFKITVISLILFALGVLGGGDCKYLIAISPWLGFTFMKQFFIILFPVALISAVVYLMMKRYKFKFIDFLKDQWYDLKVIMVFKREIINNIIQGVENPMIHNIPFSAKDVPPMPGMVMISISIVLAMLRFYT